MPEQGPLRLAEKDGAKREFGWVARPDQTEAFFHISALADASDRSKLGDGALLEFDVIASTKKAGSFDARNVKVITPAPVPVQVGHRPSVTPPTAGVPAPVVNTPPPPVQQLTTDGYEVDVYFGDVDDHGAFYHLPVYVLVTQGGQSVSGKFISVEMADGELIANPRPIARTAANGQAYFQAIFPIDPDATPQMDFVVLVRERPEQDDPAEYTFHWQQNQTVNLPIVHAVATPTPAAPQALDHRDPPEIYPFQIAKITKNHRRYQFMLKAEDERVAMAGKLRFIPDGEIEFNGETHDAEFEKEIDPHRGLIADIVTKKFLTKIFVQLIDWPDRHLTLTITGEKPPVEARTNDGYFMHLTDGWQGRIDNNRAMPPLGRLLFGSLVITYFLFVGYGRNPLLGKGFENAWYHWLVFSAPWLWVLLGFTSKTLAKFWNKVYGLFFKTNNRLSGWIWMMMWTFAILMFMTSPSASTSALSRAHYGSSSSSFVFDFRGWLSFIPFLLVTIIYTPIAWLDEFHNAYLSVTESFRERFGDDLKDSWLRNMLENYFERMDHSIPKAVREAAAKAYPAVASAASATTTQAAKHGLFGDNFVMSLVWAFLIEIAGQMLGSRFLGHHS